MSDHIKKTIEDLMDKIGSLEEEIVGYKRTVNLLCDQVGMSHSYADEDLSVGTPTMNAIKSDTFYGQALNTSVRKVLEMRKAQGLGPTTVPDIYAMLEQGGFQFGASSRDNAIRGLRISLGKSSRTFHKLPNGSYGMTSWYPDAKPQRPTGQGNSGGTAKNTDDDGDEAPDGDVDE